MHFAVLSDFSQLLVPLLIAVGIPCGVQTEVLISGRFQLLNKDLQIGLGLFFVDGSHVAVETVPSGGRDGGCCNQHDFRLLD